jgi:tRNA(Ile)-lysidine synthase
MLNQLQNYNQKEQLINPKEDRILLAISGGVDSVVLAQLLKAWGVELALAHCNFKLRGEDSDVDARFLAQLAQKLNCPYFEISFETEQEAKKRKSSIQITARELRYSWLEEIRQKEGFTYIATAHHSDDNIESLLLNLVHGAGIRGLHGILPKHPDHQVIRPLLFASKEEIRAYAAQENIHFREDASNESTKYSRNLLRHEVVPLLKELNPSLNQTFDENFQHFREIEWLYHHAINNLQKELLQKGKGDIIWKIQIPALQAIPAKQSLLFECLRPYGFQGRQAAQIIEHLKGNSGAVYQSPTHQVLRNREELILMPLPEKQTKEEIELAPLPVLGKQKQISLPDGQRLQISHYPTSDFQPKADPKIAYFDAALLAKGNLRLRRWRQGDRFQPFGLKGQHKKISSLFKDLKLSVLEKEQIWILEVEGEIAWVVGLRASEVFRVSENSSSIIEMQIQ